MNEPPGSLDVAIRFQVRQASHVIYIYIYVACASKENLELHVWSAAWAIGPGT
jgi:hypothetical protein